MASIRLFCALVFIAVGATTVARNADAEIAPLVSRADFFGNPVKIASQISPDGKWILWHAPVNGVMNVWVAPRDRLEAAQPVTTEEVRGIFYSVWAYDNRHLLYLQDKNGNGELHVYSVDIARHTTTDLTPFDNVRATISELSPKVPNEALVSINKRDPKYADLYRVKFDSGALELVAESEGFLNIIASDRFSPVIATKLQPSGGQQVLRYRKGKWTNWQEIPLIDTRSTKFLSVDAAGRNVFALDSRGRNTLALVRISLATGAETVVAEDPQADIRDDVVFDQKTGEPVIYSVDVARVAHKALVPALIKDIAYLNTQGLGDWTVDSRSLDGRYWKLTSLTDFRVAAALYDRKKHTLGRLYDPRPWLDKDPLAHMYPVTIRSRGGLDLISYLSLPKESDLLRTGVPAHPLPLVLFVHGGPHDRDVYGYDPNHQWLASRGYAVLSVNMRGSTGFGKAFLNASVGEWGTKLDDDLLDAVDWAIHNGISEPGHIGIMGGSYGGYAVLRGLTRDPNTYACGVDMYGPADLLTMQGPGATYGVSALNHNEVGDYSTPEGLARMKDQSPLYHADQIRKPLLVAQGANDPAVKPDLQSAPMVAAVEAVGTPVTYLSYPDEGHGFARAANNLSFHAVAEQFLAKCLGGKADPITAESLTGSSIEVLEGADRIPGLQGALGLHSQMTPTASVR